MITVYGEGLIDLVPQKSEPLSPLQPALGGGPFNVAIAIARQGAPVAFQSRLSTDAFGEALHSALREARVDTTSVERGDEPSTLAVTTLASDGSASFNFYNEGTADRLATPSTPAADSIAVFGTCSLAWEPAATRYVDVARAHAEAGGIVAVDPNIRPPFATDEHRERLLELFKHTTILKLSDDEVEFFGGIDKLLDSGPSIIVITRGAEGLCFHAGDATMDIDPVRIDVADTIGAGDTIMGTIAAELDARGATTLDELSSVDIDAWREILTTAATAAAITCSRTGAQVPTKAEIQEAMRG